MVETPIISPLFSGKFVNGGGIIGPVCSPTSFPSPGMYHAPPTSSPPQTSPCRCPLSFGPDRLRTPPRCPPGIQGSDPPGRCPHGRLRHVLAQRSLAPGL